MALYEFSEEEIKVLKNMIHLAVQSQGMNAAESGLILTRKLGTPVNSPKPDKIESNKKEK